MTPYPNLLTKIRDREIKSPKPGTHIRRLRQFYTDIVPNTSVGVTTPNEIILRKFTPDGRFLFAFSKNFHSLLLFKYLGHTRKSHEQYPSSLSCHKTYPIIFSDFFKICYQKSIVMGDDELYRDFCIFSQDEKYVNNPCFLFFLHSSFSFLSFLISLF